MPAVAEGLRGQICTGAPCVMPGPFELSPAPPAPRPPPRSQTYVPVNEYVQTYFGFKHSFQWATVGLLIASICAFRSLALLALKLLNFQSR